MTMQAQRWGRPSDNPLIDHAHTFVPKHLAFSTQLKVCTHYFILEVYSDDVFVAGLDCGWVWVILVDFCRFVCDF